MAVIDLSTKEDHPPQRCEVKVDIKIEGDINDHPNLPDPDFNNATDEDNWVRIPVTLCELWINKDGPADITRTAKVKFPAEWNGRGIAQYVNGFNAQNEAPYDECRIWFYDHEDEVYQVAHYGYVGGVGPASENGVMKMWVYDPADLMRGIQVSTAFGEPTIQQIVNFVVDGADAEGNPVGLQRRTVFDDIQTYIAGIQEVKVQKEDLSNFGSIEGVESDQPEGVMEALGTLGQMQLNQEDLIDDISDYMFGTEVTDGILGGQKRFQLNRHNMVDVMNWFAAEIGGKWHFEPSPDGPVLFFDNTSSRGIEREDGAFTRRMFMDDELVPDAPGGTQQVINSAQDERGDVSDYKDRNAFTTVDVLDNNALYDIKPFNTLYLYGESNQNSATYQALTNSGGSPVSPATAAAATVYMTEQFPKVKVTYPPLVERAGGYEYAAPVVNSDKIYLKQAEQAAIKEFRKHLEEETEGNIQLRGEPYILPYDYLRTVPHCNDTFINADVTPITYEVNGVKHIRSAGQQYKTEVGVSMVFDEELLEVESEYVEV